MLWGAISNTRKSVSSDIQTLRSWAAPWFFITRFSVFRYLMKHSSLYETKRPCKNKIIIITIKIMIIIIIRRRRRRRRRRRKPAEISWRITNQEKWGNATSNFPQNNTAPNSNIRAHLWELFFRWFAAVAIIASFGCVRRINNNKKVIIRTFSCIMRTKKSSNANFSALRVRTTFAT